MVVDNHKTCPRCSQNLHTDNFYKTSRKSGDGFSGYCRACTTQKARDWQKENPEALAKIHAKRYAKFATGELVRTEEQKAGIRAASDSWRKRNIDKARTVSRESKRRAKERNPELYRAKQAIQFHRRRCEKKGYPSDVTVDDWLALLDAFGRACPFCGGKPTVLDLDHLVPIHLGGYNVVGNIVPICRPCNAQKSRKAPEVFAEEMNIELSSIVDKMRVRTSDHPTRDPATHNPF